MKGLLTRGKEKIKAAFGKGDAAKPADDPAALLAKRKEQFFSAHTLAEKRVEEVKKTPGAERNDKVKTLVQEVVTLAAETKSLVEKATKPEEVETQRKRLGDIYTAANKAIVAAKGPDMADFEKAREEARATLGDMRKLPGASSDPFILGAIGPADALLLQATEAAGNAVNAEEVKAQITALKKISKYKDDAKRGSDLYLKSTPKNLPDFEKKRTAASDRLAGVRSLRGATDDPNIVNLLKNADRILAEATTAARAAKTPDEVTAQIKRLDALEVLAKNIETASEEAKARSKADQTAFPKWTDELEKAQKARDALLDVGLARDEYKQMVTLISNAQLTLAKGGAEAALKELSKYTEIVKQVEEKQQKAKTQIPPEDVARKAAAVEPFLKQLDQIAPEYASKGRRDESEALIFLGHTKSKDAIAGLEKLLTTVQDEVADFTNKKADAERKLKEYRTEHANLTGQGYQPAFFGVAAQLAKQAELTDIAGREWGRANQHLDAAIKGLADVVTAQGKAKSDWEAGAKERADMRALAKSLGNWPPLKNKASDLRDPLRQLDEQLKATGDFAACQAEYESLNLAQVKADLEDARDAQTNMPSEDQLEKFDDAMREADKEVGDAFRMAFFTLANLEKKLMDMPDPTATMLHKNLRDLKDEWQAILNNPPGQDPKALAKPMIDGAAGITKSASDLLKNPKEIANYQKGAQRFDAARADGSLAKELAGMLKQLDRADIQLPSQNQRLAVLLRPATPENERADGLLALHEELKGLVESEKQKERDRVAKTKEAVDRAVNQPLARFKDSPGYKKVLETEAEDITAMADSDDPYFLQMARHDTVTLAKKVAAVDPKQRGDDATRYKKVEAMWDELSKGLAGDMKDLMPRTHEALRKELATLVGETKKASPEDGLKILADIKKRIEAAKDRLATVKADQEAYKKRRERLTKQWDQIKKDTRTRVTDRTTAFADALDARLNEADAALKEENGATRANGILQKLEDSLRKVEISDDPRAELQKQDAQIEQEQRAIRDMARAFKEEIKYFKETIIPRARTLVKERAAAGKGTLEKGKDMVKEGLSKVANALTKANAGGGNADLDLLDSLEATLKNASKPVEPYLKMLDTVAIGTAKTPQLSAAQSAFQSARGMLSSAARTVDSLQTVTGTTSMSVTKDLKKVEANWIAQAQNYAKTVQGMGAAIRDAAKDESDQATKDAADKAAKIVIHSGSDFSPGAFAPEIAALDKKDAPETEKLSAREKALTTMRAYRKVLLEHPVHTRIADPKNPFADGSKMRAAARGVLVALKRIELETLIGV